MTQRWVNGKCSTEYIRDLCFKQGKRAVVSKSGGSFKQFTCSSQTPCSWVVNVVRSRKKGEESYWYVSSADIGHKNCTGFAKASTKQLEKSAVLNAAVLSDNKISQSALAGQLKLQEQFINKPVVVYLAKQNVLRKNAGKDIDSIKKLPSFLSKLQEMNEGIFCAIECDDQSHFMRALVILDPNIFVKGQTVFGIDAAHMKHRLYNGVQVVFVGRDGNLQNCVVAVALIPLENEEHYKWIFSKLQLHGFPLSDYPIFADRHKGIVANVSRFNLRIVFCTRHIIGIY